MGGLGYVVMFLLDLDCVFVEGYIMKNIVCVCVTGHQSGGRVRVMRWWSSNLGQLPLLF